MPARARARRGSPTESAALAATSSPAAPGRSASEVAVGVGGQLVGQRHHVERRAPAPGQAGERAREQRRRLDQRPAVPPRRQVQALAVERDVEARVDQEAQTRALAGRQVAVDGRPGGGPRSAALVERDRDQDRSGLGPVRLAHARVAGRAARHGVGAAATVLDDLHPARLVRDQGQRAPARPAACVDALHAVERQQHLARQRLRSLEEAVGVAVGIGRVAQRQDQHRAPGPGGRVRRQRAWDRHVGDLERERPRVDLRPLADLVHRLEADPEEADLLGALRGLPDREHADHVPRVERRAVVLNGDAVVIDGDGEAARARVVGVLQELDQEVTRVGVDLAGQELLGAGLRQRPGLRLERLEDGAGEAIQPRQPSVARADRSGEVLEVGAVGAGQAGQQRVADLVRAAARDQLAAARQRVRHRGGAQVGRGVLEPAVDQAERRDTRDRQPVDAGGQRLDQRARRPAQLVETAQDPAQPRVRDAEQELGQPARQLAVDRALPGQAGHRVGQGLMVPKSGQLDHQLARPPASQRGVDRAQLFGKRQRAQVDRHGPSKGTASRASCEAGWTLMDARIHGQPDRSRIGDRGARARPAARHPARLGSARAAPALRRVRGRRAARAG